MVISCEKENIDKRTLVKLNDHYLTINAGDTYETCYQKLQDLYKSNQIINFLNIQNDGFNTIDNYNTMIPLYSGFCIIGNGNNNRGDTIVFSFNKDILTNIYNLNVVNTSTGGPIFLEEWPGSTESSTLIKKGDSKEEIFGKLVSLRTKGELDKIIYTIKDLDTGYDSYSAKSIMWSVIESYDTINKRQNYLNIHFALDVIKGIEIGEVKVRALN